MMYGSWTWCHLKVTTWKPWLSSCALPGSCSTPRTRGSTPSASSASSSPPLEPGAPRPNIAATAQHPVQTLMACGSCCARRDALRPEPLDVRDPRDSRRVAWSRAHSGRGRLSRSPPAPVAFNPAAPGRGLPAPAARTRARTPSHALGTPAQPAHAHPGPTGRPDLISSGPRSVPSIPLPYRPARVLEPGAGGRRPGGLRSRAKRRNRFPRGGSQRRVPAGLAAGRWAPGASGAPQWRSLSSPQAAAYP